MPSMGANTVGLANGHPDELARWRRGGVRSSDNDAVTRGALIEMRGRCHLAITATPNDVGTLGLRSQRKAEKGTVRRRRAVAFVGVALHRLPGLDGRPFPERGLFATNPLWHER